MKWGAFAGEGIEEAQIMPRNDDVVGDVGLHEPEDRPVQVLTYLAIRSVAWCYHRKGYRPLSVRKVRCVHALMHLVPLSIQDGQ